MITNLLCSVIVTLITNTSERFPQHQEPDPAPLGSGVPSVTLEYRYKMVDDKNPTTKWVRTTIIERETVTVIKANDPAFVGKSFLAWERTVSDLEQQFYLKRVDTWETNEPPKVVINPAFSATNVIAWPNMIAK
jgi:hypothetical protein